MECTFQVGDKVTLVDGKWSDAMRHCTPNLPAFNEIYTIREVLPDPKDRGEVDVRLAEIINPERYYWDIDRKLEPAFAADRFRRVISTDISDLQKIARDVFEGQRELLPMGAIR